MKSVFDTLQHPSSGTQRGLIEKMVSNNRYYYFLSEHPVKGRGNKSSGGLGDIRHLGYPRVTSQCCCWGKKCMGDGLYAQTYLPRGRICLKVYRGRAKVQ